MELELGLKLTRIADKFSSADFLFAKDRAGPVFISTETDTMFILTAHLKGYRKQNIEIEINEDGTKIVIRGEKAIRETVMVGIRWELYKTETEMKRFRKAFKIPDGVILDKIKAKYNDDESILTISMRKKEKGIRGFNIEEVKEQELAREGSETLQIVPDEVPKNGVQENHEETEAEYAEETDLEDEESSKLPEIESVKEPKEVGLNVANPEETQAAEVHDMKEEEMEENQLDQSEWLQKPLDHTETIEEAKIFPDEVTGEGSAKPPVVESHSATDETSQGESVTEAQKLEKKEISKGVERNMEREHDQPAHSNEVTDQDQHIHDHVDGNESDIQEEESALVKPPDVALEGKCSKIEEDRGRCKMCTPILAGSALLLSFVVFVIQVVRTKSQQGKRKE